MISSQEKIALIILQWNRSTDTLACIESVLRIEYPHYEILIVDNGSDPHELRAVRQAFPELTYIENQSNLGFAEGNNRGIQVALARGADYILILNNDTTVDPHLLTAFLSAARAYPEAGVFGAKIYYFEDPTDIWYAGGQVDPRLLRCYHEGCTESDLHKNHEQIKDTGYACGCALFIKREVIQKIGMMDPRFFLLWEEIDWCWRIRQGGYRCLFVPQAKVWHKISRSFIEGNRGPSWQYFYFRNRLLFIQRHIPWKQRLIFYTTIFLRELLEMITLCLHPKTSSARRKLNTAALKGICHYFLKVSLHKN